MYAAEEFSLAARLKKGGEKSNRDWKIIKHLNIHSIITSNREFSKFGGIEMIGHNDKIDCKSEFPQQILYCGPE